MPIADSQGTTFTFGSIEFVAKNVKVKRAQAAIDVTPLSAASGSMREYQPAPLKDGDVITCEYFGDTAPPLNAVAAIACANLGISGNAICEDFELTAAVGELLMGTATFRLTA